MARIHTQLLAAAALTALVAGEACGAGLTGGSHAVATTGVESGSLVAPLVRMVLSLGAVLGLVAGLAWLAKRLRQGARARSGLIEIMSGVSLGTRDKVVLLRVGNEQVLVGVSPSGMRALHVMKDGTAAPPPFNSYLDGQPS